ncbi:beta-ketoacyl synthase N-terminal-like domain-containing protein [Pendulispora albinea]|uniref:Polyketide synthase dehydratase domain-containing protein n=1 Tax=Pendulispora albinea TaxID=2741071 RepID=A0ABZ2M8E2_9BACT
MSERQEPVAIVGMACLFPGAPDLDTYYRNLREGRDAITAVSPSRIDPVFFDRNVRASDRFYCQRGGFIDDLARFDAAGFGVMPLAARGAEPDQLLALEVAAQALGDAGYRDRPFARDRTAVIVGRGGYAGAGRTRLEQHVRAAEQIVTTLRALLPDLDETTLARVKAEFQSQVGAAGEGAAIGLVPNLAASRIAHRLDLHGPAFTVDAACASALVAVDQGCTELRSRRCDVVMAGGVHLCQDEAFWSVFCQLGALSPTETIRPFDRRADGLLIGEGIGMFILKRLEDAERADDRIYAVVRGCGTSSDGRGATLLSPSVEGQVLALERAWREADLDPASVGLLEAHGTGTPAGDAAELTTLARVFGRAEGSAPRAVAGSVKSMIGHAMPAAGAAGLIKAALAVYHGELLPSLHCDEPSKLLDATRFRVLPRTEPWESPVPRRAGINAFGFGGINAHVVIEQHAARRRVTGALGSTSAIHPARGVSPVPPRGSAGAGEPNKADTDRVALFSAAALPELLDDLANARERTRGGPARIAIFDPTPERIERARTIASRGKPWRGRDGIFFAPEGLLSAGGTLAFLFPGVDASFEPRVDDLAEYFDVPLPPHMRPQNLYETGVGIIGVNRLLDGTLRRLGIVPKDVAGHSIGEWSGMIATGITPEGAVDAFVANLGPDKLKVPGVVFAAAGCSMERAEAAMAGLQEIALSHDNCPHQVIFCGREESVDVALARLKEDSVLCQKLPFQSGFHSPLFADYLGPHREHLELLAIGSPKAPLWSATTCAPYPKAPDDIRALALEHLVAPVRFRQLISALHAQGTRVFVQVGTGSLVGFVEDTLRGQPHLAIASNVKDRSGLSQLRRVLASLFVEGADIGLAYRGQKLLPEEPALTLPPPSKEGASVRPPAPRTVPMALALGVPLVRKMAPLERSSAHTPTPSLPRGLDAAGTAPTGLDARVAPMAPPAPAAGTMGRRPSHDTLPEGHPLAAEFAENLSAMVDAQREILTLLATPAARPRQVDLVRTLSIETMPSLIDHAFYRQPKGWSVLSDLHPVVPMTTLVDLMIEHAEHTVPGRAAVALEDVRAYRWLAISKPVELPIQCRYDGKDRVHVRLGDYSEATVILADRYEPAPPDDTAPLAGAAPAPIDARTLYDDRWMFHGPQFQGVVDVGIMGEGGIRGVLEVGEARGAFLDNAGQLFGYWVMARYETNRLAMPVRIGKVNLYGPHPPPGERFSCTVRIRSIDDKSVVADLTLGRGGRAWAVIESWEDRRFDSDPRFWNMLIWPEKSYLGALQPEGFVLFEDPYRAAPTRDQMARRILGEAERADYERQGPRKQRAWLTGRAAAKDAVRELLGRLGHGPLFPVEVTLSNEPSGRPIVHTRTPHDIRVSIAHKDDTAVAIARIGVDVGIDIERIEPRSESFAELSFTAEELRLVADEPREIGWTRLWAAKEAVAKARGTGLEGAPLRFPVRDRVGERLLVGGDNPSSTDRTGLWVDTKRHGNFIIGWTVHERTK